MKFDPGMGCLVLFSLPFMLVGVFMSAMVTADVITVIGLRSWKEVPATVVDTYLDEYVGDESVSYEAKVAYNYEVDGQTYYSERVSFLSFNDSGDGQIQLQQRYAEHMAEGKPITAYVDPNDPSRSVLDRSMKPGGMIFALIFAIVFGGAGVGVCMAGVAGMRKK